MSRTTKLTRRQFVSREAEAPHQKAPPVVAHVMAQHGDTVALSDLRGVARLAGFPEGCRLIEGDPVAILTLADGTMEAYPVVQWVDGLSWPPDTGDDGRYNALYRLEPWSLQVGQDQHQGSRVDLCIIDRRARNMPSSIVALRASVK